MTLPQMNRTSLNVDKRKRVISAQSTSICVSLLHRVTTDNVCAAES